MKVDKVKYTVQYEAGRKVSEWIGIEASPDEGETADEAFKAAQIQVNRWHNEINPHLEFENSSLPVIQSDNANAALVDEQFEKLKADLEKIGWRQEAEAILSGTDFRYNILLKKIVNSKPLMP